MYSVFEWLCFFPSLAASLSELWVSPHVRGWGWGDNILGKEDARDKATERRYRSWSVCVCVCVVERITICTLSPSLIQLSATLNLMIILLCIK